MSTSTISPLLKIGLGLIGMWPGSSYGMFLWLFYMATLVAMQYFQYSYVFAHFNRNDFSNLMDGLSVTLDYTLTFLKLLSLWRNRRIFFEILSVMDDDWNDCATDSYACVMLSKANLAHRCSNAMMTLNSMSTVFYFIGSFISHRTISAKGDPREFPVQIQFPFDATDSPIFEFVVLGLFLHVWETAIVIAMLNSLILTLVLHVSGQIDIMCQGLKEISSTRKSHSSATRSLIKRHQRIISLSNSIDNFFSFVALIQFMWNTVVICSIGFMIIIKEFREEKTLVFTLRFILATYFRTMHYPIPLILESRFQSFTRRSLGTDMDGKSGILIQSIIPYIAVTLEAFVFCFAGEYLSSKSRSIGDAAYETLWYDLSASECRILLLIIVRSQKRLTITAGKIMDLTLEGFTTVMKASASYISVLHAMY